MEVFHPVIVIIGVEDDGVISHVVRYARVVIVKLELPESTGRVRKVDSNNRAFVDTDACSELRPPAVRYSHPRGDEGGIPFFVNINEDGNRGQCWERERHWRIILLFCFLLLSFL